MNNNQAILHRAEESGQSRILTIGEVGAYGVMGGLKGVIMGLAGSTAFSLLRAITGDLTMADVGLSFVGFGAISTAWHLLADLDDLKDGLRSFRTVETFTPPIVETMPASPIVVRPLNASPYVLDRDEPAALPDGRQVGLGLNPPTLAAILQEIIQQHNGQWSRRRLMGIRIGGERVTRALYEGMTDALAKANFLQPQPQGGFCLPNDITTFEDVRRYFPGLLPIGQAGGQAGRLGQRGQNNTPPTQGRGNLASKRLKRWMDCGCDVKAYRLVSAQKP